MVWLACLKNILDYKWTQIKDRRMDHPLCPVRRTDDEKYCRTVNQPSRLHRTVLTPNFNIEFSSLARQSFVHCTCSESITSIKLQWYVENLISTAVSWMYSVVKVRYIGVGPRPEDWQDLPLIYPTILLGTLCTHNGIVMLELICHRLRHCSHCILMPYSSDGSAEINMVLVFEWMVGQWGGRRWRWHWIAFMGWKKT